MRAKPAAGSLNRSRRVPARGTRARWWPASATGTSCAFFSAYRITLSSFHLPVSRPSASVNAVVAVSTAARVSVSRLAMSPSLFSCLATSFSKSLIAAVMSS